MRDSHYYLENMCNLWSTLFRHTIFCVVEIWLKKYFVKSLDHLQLFVLVKNRSRRWRIECSLKNVNFLLSCSSPILFESMGFISDELTQTIAIVCVIVQLYYCICIIVCIIVFVVIICIIVQLYYEGLIPKRCGACSFSFY